MSKHNLTPEQLAKISAEAKQARDFIQGMPDILRSLVLVTALKVIIGIRDGEMQPPPDDMSLVDVLHGLTHIAAGVALDGIREIEEGRKMEASVEADIASGKAGQQAADLLAKIRQGMH